MREFEQKKPESHSSSPFFGPKIQTKLTTGAVGDRYEVEADKVADKVVNNKKSGGLLQSKKEERVQQKPISETISTVQKQDLAQEQPLQKKGKDKEEDKKVQKKSDKEEDKKVQKKGEKEEDKKTVQKKCADCEGEDKKVQKKGEKEEDKKVQKKGKDKEEDKKVQKKGDKEEEKKPVQAKLNDARPVNNDVESDLNSSKGGGKTMDKNTRQEMESGFGADFSKVTIHTDSKAVQMSEQLGAQAFTHGNDVYFNKGKYNPDSKEGKHLLAHELTHTIQQTGAIQKSEINETHPDDLRAERPENPQYKGDPVLEKANDNQGNITFGHKGEAVQKIQTGLMDLGFQLPKFGTDGDFGSETRNAVIDFQSHSEIGVDGIVGPQTMGTLDNALIAKGGKKGKKKEPKNKCDNINNNFSFSSTNHFETLVATSKCKTFDITLDTTKHDKTSNCKNYQVHVQDANGKIVLSPVTIAVGGKFPLTFAATTAGTFQLAIFTTSQCGDSDFKGKGTKHRR